MARSSPRPLAFLIALLCAMSVRLLTPQGWMPDLRGGHEPGLVICTGDGVLTLPAPAHEGHAPADKATGHDLCAFAGLALAAAPPPAGVEAAAAVTHVAEPPVLADQQRLAPAWRRPQAARAPPALA